MKVKKQIKILFALIIIISNISCDQISKKKVREKISINETIKVLGDNFILTKVENTGAALSLGSNLHPDLKIIFLQILPLIGLFFVFIYMVRDKKITQLNLFGLSFIIGGGIGNIYDRILYNSVTDFMYLEYGFLHTGIFNMADVSVVVGTLFIVLNIIVFEMNKKRHKTVSL